MANRLFQACHESSRIIVVRSNIMRHLGLGCGNGSEFTLEAPAIGDLFHGALKWVSDEMMRLGKSWAELTKEECWQLAQDAVEHIITVFL